MIKYVNRKIYIYIEVVFSTTLQLHEKRGFTRCSANSSNVPNLTLKVTRRGSERAECRYMLISDWKSYWVQDESVECSYLLQFYNVRLTMTSSSCIPVGRRGKLDRLAEHCKWTSEPVAACLKMERELTFRQDFCKIRICDVGIGNIESFVQNLVLAILVMLEKS